jgi:hypothetical protein
MGKMVLPMILMTRVWLAGHAELLVVGGQGLELLA